MTVTTAQPVMTRFLGGESARTTRPALEWLWKYLQDVANPCLLDCGLV